MRTKWAIQLVICTILIILVVKAVQTVSKKFGKSFYNISFNEGNINNTLEIVAKKRIQSIEKSENLVSYLSDINNSQYVYRLNFINTINRYNCNCWDKYPLEIIKKVKVKIEI